MTQILLTLWLLAALLCPAATHGTVHVREYTRKDGTVVHAHDRSAPGAARETSKGGSTRATSVPRTTFAPSPTPVTFRPIARDADGGIKRSTAAKDAFERENRCPSSGRLTGPCPGYVIDHVKPLACGGTDAPANMQWQTISAAKAKDKAERVGCQAR